MKTITNIEVKQANRYYFSNALIWWDNDSNDKPSQTYFNSIVWTEIVGANKTNWIDILKSSITLNKNHKPAYVKKVIAGEPNQYFFVDNIVVKTAGDYVYELELDVWSTYILPSYLTTIASFSRLAFLPNNIKSNTYDCLQELPITPYDMKNDYLALIEPEWQYSPLSEYRYTMYFRHNGRTYKEIDMEYNTLIVPRVADIINDGATLITIFGKQEQYKRNISIRGEPGYVKPTNIWFILQDNTGIKIFPVFNNSTQFRDTTTIEYEVSSGAIIKHGIYNTYGELMKYVNDASRISAFKGVFLGAPLLDMLDPFTYLEKWAISSGASQTTAGLRPFYIHFDQPLNELPFVFIKNNRYGIVNPDVSIFRQDVYNGISSIRTNYSFLKIYGNVIDIKNLWKPENYKGITLPLSTNFDGNGCQIFSQAQDGINGYLGSNWLDITILPAISDNYSKYVASISSSINNGIRQIQQERKFKIDSGAYQQAEDSFGNVVGGVGSFLSGDFASTGRAIGNIFNIGRQNTTARKGINMSADNQLKGIKASFEDKARTLISTATTTLQDVLPKMYQAYTTNSGLFHLINRYSPRILRFMGYTLFHYYNGYLCDITLKFSDIVNTPISPSEYNKMYVFKINETNLNEYVNLNYNFTIYEKSLVRDIFKSTIRVWDIKPNLDDLKTRIRDLEVKNG